MTQAAAASPKQPIHPTEVDEEACAETCFLSCWTCFSSAATFSVSVSVSVSVASRALLSLCSLALASRAIFARRCFCFSRFFSALSCSFCFRRATRSPLRCASSSFAFSFSLAPGTMCARLQTGQESFPPETVSSFSMVSPQDGHLYLTHFFPSSEE